MVGERDGGVGGEGEDEGGGRGARHAGAAVAEPEDVPGWWGGGGVGGGRVGGEWTGGLG